MLRVSAFGLQEGSYFLNVNHMILTVCYVVFFH